MVEIREVLSIESSVRYYTPPWLPSHSVHAKNHISAGTFVLIYSGEIEEEIQHKDSVYVYQVEAEQVRDAIPEYTGPNLYLDAQNYGNVARFVNDSRYRDAQVTPNLKIHFIVLDGMLFLAYYATCDIKIGEELVVSYGEEYCK